LYGLFLSSDSQSDQLYFCEKHVYTKY